jgi:phage-related protein
MVGELSIGGTALSAFDVKCCGRGLLQGAVRDVGLIGIPGRGGDLARDLGRHENLSARYVCYITEDLEANLRELRDFLATLRGYVRIEDSLHPDEYLLGVYTGSFDPVSSPLRIAEQFTLEFSVQPRRYLIAGETPYTLARATFSGITAPYTIGTELILQNPTRQAAQPMVRAWYTDYREDMSLTVGNTLFYIKPCGHHMIGLDCRNARAYFGAEGLGQYVSLVELGGSALRYASGWPVLPAGTSSVLLGDNCQRAEVVPNWWRG